MNYQYRPRCKRCSWRCDDEHVICDCTCHETENPEDCKDSMTSEERSFNSVGWDGFYPL